MKRVKQFMTSSLNKSNRENKIEMVKGEIM